MSTYKTTAAPRIEGKGQTCDYIEHGVLEVGNGHTLRVLIHCDSHAYQAWARIERWDGTQWHEVASVRGEALLMDTNVGYQLDRLAPAAQLALFRRDRDVLQTLAEEVL